MDPDLTEFYDARLLPKPCKVPKVLAELDEPDRDLILRALDDPRAVDGRIAAGIKQRGPSIGASTVSKHRAGECGCPRPDDVA